MKWPRGKYNGQRISGVDLHLRINVLWWCWVPHISFRYTKYVHWLCFHFWYGLDFKD
jgi:hypothetical protein